jgi:integrase
VEKDAGMPITAHQFRHAAAALMLRENAGNSEFVRRVLASNVLDDALLHRLGGLSGERRLWLRGRQIANFA